MKRFDLILFCSTIALTLFGLLMIYEASSFVAFRDFSDKYHYLRDQSVWILIGFLGLGFFSIFDYHKFYYLALPLLLTAIVLLLLVFIPGIGVRALGAHRWINLGFTVLQPAEFVKLALAIYLAAWFSFKEKGRLLAFLLLMGLVLGLVMLEPDMGTAAIILSEALIIYFLSGANIATFLVVLPAVVAAGFLLIVFEPYRAKRLAAFLNPVESISSSYHIKQILIALGMGGFGGVGLGNSLQKFAYLPENTTDSIFAIIAEEFGFLGAFVLIAVLLVVVWRGFVIASHAKDQFGTLLAAGIIVFLGMQTLINLGAQTVLIPVTGVPLPFISYGGSALIVDLIAIGVLLNISRQGRI